MAFQVLFKHKAVLVCGKPAQEDLSPRDKSTEGTDWDYNPGFRCARIDYESHRRNHLASRDIINRGTNSSTKITPNTTTLPFIIPHLHPLMTFPNPTNSSPSFLVCLALSSTLKIISNSCPPRYIKSHNPCKILYTIE